MILGNIKVLLDAFLVVGSIILGPLYFIRVIFRILYLIWLYQLKEYRIDRLMAHFRETKEGMEFLFNRNAKMLWILFLSTPFLYFYQVSFLLYPYMVAVFLLFTLEIKDFLWEVRKKQLRRPVFTIKAALIFVLTLIIAGGVSAIFNPIPLFFNPIKLLLIDRLLLFIVCLSVLLLSVPSVVLKKFLMDLAKRKIADMKNLIVIGVTGSYGKSSTKELIADFLGEKYKVLKTHGSVNTEIGIARFILQKLKREHEIFVVEVGAYKRGEIAEVCKMVRPTIGVLTGINEQHLSLFGNIENTKKAKLELIESLSENGIALFNGDDQMTFDLSKHQKSEISLYSAKQLPVSARDKKNPFLSNIAAAYVLAQKLGVNDEVLKEKIKKTMKTLGIKVIKRDNLTILDDSYNSNPKGFQAALDVLSTYKGRKVLITPGIIELGKESDRIHRELGERIGTICDVVILTNDNFAEPIREGLSKTSFDVTKPLVLKREDIVAIVKNQIQGETTVLLEGRMPVEVKDYLTN